MKIELTLDEAKLIVKSIDGCIRNGGLPVAEVLLPLAQKVQQQISAEETSAE